MLGHYFSVCKSSYIVILPVVSEAPDISYFNLFLQSKVPASANHYKHMICLNFITFFLSLSHLLHCFFFLLILNIYILDRIFVQNQLDV